MLQLSDVALFVNVAYAGSLAGAARRMSIPPMRASRRLDALEEELGVRLVQRTTRALALTPEGKAFLPHAQAMLEDEVEARAAVRPETAGASGLLRITASVPFGSRIIAPFVPAFARANPAVRVDLVLTDGIVDIVGQGIDLAIRIADLRDSTLIARKLALSPRALFASPEYVAEHGTPRCITDLTKHDCLVISGTTEWIFLSHVGERFKQRIDGRFSANSPEALRQACLGGMGIALLSAWITAQDVEDGRLLSFPLEDGKPDPYAVWAVYPSSRLVPAKVSLFNAALQEHLSTDRASWFKDQ